MSIFIKVTEESTDVCRLSACRLSKCNTSRFFTLWAQEKQMEVIHTMVILSEAGENRMSGTYPAEAFFVAWNINWFDIFITPTNSSLQVCRASAATQDER